MSDLFQLLLLPHNVVYTMLMALMLLYWLSVIIGGLDIDAIDFDLDFDTDVDADMDTGFHFMNFGKVPFMLILSLIILVMWVTNFMFFNYVENTAWWRVLLMILPFFCIALLVTRMLCIPLIPFFNKLNKDMEDVDPIGMSGYVKIPIGFKEMGQLEITLPNQSTLLLLSKRQYEGPSIHAGSKALVVSRNEDIYLVKEIIEK